MQDSCKVIFVIFFMVTGFLALGWLTFRLGEVFWLRESETYMLASEFTNISGVKVGNEIQIAGVRVGNVQQIYLNKDSYAVIEMQIDRAVKIPVDSVASVKSRGIIGDKYINITMGKDKKTYKLGETIIDTESAIDLESSISEIVFGRMGER